MPDPADPRLPRAVLPTRYELTIAPDLDTGRYAGDVTIALDVADPTNDIVLHAHQLDVELDALTQGGRPLAADLTIDAEAERVVVHAPDLQPGAATLTLRFRGVISDALVGFYRSTYTNAAGDTKVLATTQFEAPHARRAFPCFDEPEFKAVFSIALVVDEGLTALSNGPEIDRATVDGGRVRVQFADTIKMSTYLVAFIVGELEVTAPVDVAGVPLRVAHVPGRGHLTEFASKVGAFALKFFDDYYGIPYPGEKLDLVALPDFAFGAMENLGCVTFRESALLVDRDHVTQAEASQVALTIVHEIAHMWFGDLVTMKWWNGIWLNEAFATFMEHAGVDALRPEWRTWDDFAIGRAMALDIDALSNTRAVEYEVRTPEDADGMFDILTYQKGGSVVRMLEQWLGPEAFREGVRHYLDIHRYGNTETTDLWDAIEHATDRPARRIMDSWIFQPGYPEVRVEATNGDVRLSQRRFRYDGATTTEHWPVPMLVRDARAGSDARPVLLDDDTTLETNGTPIVGNAGGEGFYRVEYPADWPARLIATAGLSARERFVLVDDAWAGVLVGTMRAHEFLDFARAFGDESDLIVWRSLLARLRALTRLVDGDALARLRADAGDLARGAFTRLGWDARPDEDPRDRALRGVLLDGLGTVADDREVAARAAEYRDRDATDADVVAACVTVTAAHGYDDLFDDYFERFRDAVTPQDQLRYLYSLALFPSEHLALRVADIATSDAVRTQNAPFVLQRALAHRDNGPLVWEFVRDNWSTIERRFPRTLIPRMLEGVTWLVDDASFESVQRHMAAHPIPEGERVIAQHLERQRVHRNLVERDRDELTAALLATV
jgi:puromycin-sensitive aminopeptidase